MTNFRETLEHIIGKPEEEARKQAGDAGYRMRVRMRNGVHLIGTADYNVQRVNVIVAEGIVTGIISLG